MLAGQLPGLSLVMAVAKSGWTMWRVTVVRRTWMPVPSTAGEITTVGILKMLELFVKVSWLVNYTDCRIFQMVN